MDQSSSDSRKTLNQEEGKTCSGIGPTIALTATVAIAGIGVCGALQTAGTVAERIESIHKAVGSGAIHLDTAYSPSALGDPYKKIEGPRGPIDPIDHK